MELRHNGMTITFDDDWWVEAGMIGFVPHSTSYRANERVSDRWVFQVAINDIAPVRRVPGIGIFDDSHDPRISARERVVSLLRGFRNNDDIPPVELGPAPEGSAYLFKLTHGTHRHYCSLAAGFTHVPGVMGYDISARDVQAMSSEVLPALPASTLPVPKVIAASGDQASDTS